MFRAAATLLSTLLLAGASDAAHAQSAFPQVNIDMGCEDWARRTNPAMLELKAQCMRTQADYRAALLAAWPATAESLRATCAQSAVRDNSYTALAQCLASEGREP